MMLLGFPHCSTDRALWPLCLGRAALGGVLCYSYDAAWLSALQHRSGSVTPLYGRAALGDVLCDSYYAAWAFRTAALIGLWPLRMGHAALGGVLLLLV